MLDRGGAGSMGGVFLRAPILIWKMLTAELLRGLLFSTGAIVLVVSFGATIKPIADGSIGAVDAMKFMGFAVIPMLQYALPFGACMAATLGYHRFASENEVVAASASGVSYGALIVPALAAGAVLGASLLFLTGHLAPRFTRQLESLVTKDAAHTIVRQIEMGQSVTIDDMILHADEAHRIGATPGSGAIDYFLLKGVVAAQVDKQSGELSADLASERADVWLYPAESDGESVVAVYMRVTGGVAKQADEALIRLRRTDFGPWIIPGALGDDLDYMTNSELRAVTADPESFRPVVRRRDESAAVLATSRVRSEIVNTIASEGQLTLVDPDGGRLVVSDVRSGLGGDRLEPIDGAEAISVTWRRDGGGLRQLRADSGTITVRVNAQEKTGRISIELLDVSGVDEREGRRESLTLGEAFTLPNDPAPGAFTLSADQLIEISSATQDETLAASGRRLSDYILDVRREAVGNQHQRAALSLASFLMTPLGAVMALRLREKIPLHVYLWSFFPALACVVIASGGASIAEESGDVGLYVIWAGCAAFGAFGLFEFLRLRRH